MTGRGRCRNPATRTSLESDDGVGRPRRADNEAREASGAGGRTGHSNVSGRPARRRVSESYAGTIHATRDGPRVAGWETEEEVAGTTSNTLVSLLDP